MWDNARRDAPLSLVHLERGAAAEDKHLLQLHIILGKWAGCRSEATPNKELFGVISLIARSFRKQIYKRLLEHVVVGQPAVSEGLSHRC